MSYSYEALRILIVQFFFELLIYIDKSAVSLSISAIKIPHSQINNVRKRAGIGSPR